MKTSYAVAIFIFALVVLRLALGPFGDSLRADGTESAAQRQQTGLVAKKPPAQLSKTESIAAVRIKSFEAQQYQSRLVFRGQTEAKRTVTLKAEASGIVIDLPVEKGALVAKGDPIARLADDNKSAFLREARTLLAQKQLEYKAASKLSSEGYAAETRLAEAKAGLEGARTNLSQRELDLSHTAIKAPFAAFLDQRLVERGDFLSIGDSVAELVDLSKILISAQVNEKLVSRIKVGNDVEATLSTGQKAHGKISYIAARADANTRTFRIEAEAPNPDFAITDGMTAEMTIRLAPKRAHFLSPALLTINDAGEMGVYVVNDNSAAHFFPITIIDNTSDGIWVTGMPDRVKLIVVGQEFVTEGQKLKAVDAKSLQTISILTVDQQS